MQTRKLPCRFVCHCLKIADTDIIETIIFISVLEKSFAYAKKQQNIIYFSYIIV